MPENGAISESSTRPADPEDVDREAVIGMGDCPNCGPKSLTPVSSSTLACCAWRPPLASRLSLWRDVT